MTTDAAHGLTSAFEPLRGWLTGLAYRMLGSHAEAEDVVQEAWLRWREAPRDTVSEPRAYLARTVTRLCLDRLKSARARRECYVGPWLPEPILDDAALRDGGDPADDFAGDLSYAFLLALERLSPLERAAFLLHDVFDTGFPEIAAVLGRSEAACRQLASRARGRLRDARPRFKASEADCQRLATAFTQAAQSGDAAALKALLAADACLMSDGGGNVVAVRRPLRGHERIAKLLVGLRRRYPLPPGARQEYGRINGLPGYLIVAADGRVLQTTALQIGAGIRTELRIEAIYIVRNPAKLAHLARGHA
jgi:RNA polymerase sigma-70 factor (ECF subfamily)